MFASTSASKNQSQQSSAINITSDVNTQNLDLTFQDSKTAFKSKTNAQLFRGLFVFQLCSFKMLIDNQQMLQDVARKVLGKKLFNAFMRNTFYGHFVAGEDQVGIKPNVESMMKYGVKSILDYSAEEDLNSTKKVKVYSQEELDTRFKRALINPSEVAFEKNTQIFIDCVDAVAHTTNQTGIGAVKMTSLIRPQLLLKFSTLCSQIQKPPYDRLNWEKLMARNEQDFAKCFNDLPDIFKNATPEGEKIIEQNGEVQVFTEKELKEIRNMFSRLTEILDYAISKEVRIFIDAEQTYFQHGIRRLTMELMRHFNKERCTVLNTYQNYLKQTGDELRADLELSVRENFHFGAKLVRGAYLEQERERAEEMNYEDPTNVDYEATTAMYENSLLYVLEQINKNPIGKINVMVASHNEDTVKFTVEQMTKHGITPKDRVICFGQLLGMCDYISFYLGGVGYSVYKYVPYGPIDEVLPYLSRRATENGAIFEKMVKEKGMITKELKRRFANLQFVHKV